MSEERASIPPKPDRDVILGFHRFYAERAVHYENQREKAALVILILAGFIFNAFNSDKTAGLYDAILAFVLFIVGIFGFLFIQNNFYRRRFHKNRAAVFRKEFDRFFLTILLSS